MEKSNYPLIGSESFDIYILTKIVEICNGYKSESDILNIALRDGEYSATIQSEIEGLLRQTMENLNTWIDQYQKWLNTCDQKGIKISLKDNVVALQNNHSHEVFPSISYIKKIELKDQPLPGSDNYPDIILLKILDIIFGFESQSDILKIGIIDSDLGYCQDEFLDSISANQSRIGFWIAQHQQISIKCKIPSFCKDYYRAFQSPGTFQQMDLKISLVEILAKALSLKKMY